MFSLGGDEDDHDFMSGGSSSKLANLFGVDKASGQGGNESLKYTAPKQPKKEAPQAQQSGGGQASSLMKACAVHAYKYVDNQYASQGKVGAAVLGHPQSKDYKILLYYSKTQPLTSAKISANFKLTVQKNRYATFYDDSRQSWSMLFDTDADIIEFAKQVALGIANCWTPGQEALVSQDLDLGEGPALENDDSVEVRYTGWLLQNYMFGQVFDSNLSGDKPYRFKIGKGKVIKGWDEGVVGMCKGGKRLLVVPPSLAYGAQGKSNRIPPNSTLIFETEIGRVKFSRDRESPETNAVPLPALPTRDSLDQPEETVKGRSKSISEQLSQAPKSDKARLLSRMKNLGQAIIPSAQSQSHDGDDEATDASAEESPESPQVMESRPHVKPALPNKPVIHQQQTMPVQMNPMMQQPMTTQQQIAENMMTQQAMLQNMHGVQAQTSQLALFQPMQQGFQQPVYGQQPPQYNQAFPQQQMQQAPAPVPVQPPPPAATPPQSQSDANLPVFFSEARQQSTEVRLSIGKVSDKIDRIMEKMDSMQNAGNLNAQQLALHSSMPNMEAGMLMQNIQRLVQDNDRLKKDLFEKSQKIESQNEKIAELLTRNQTDVEKRNTFIEERNDAFKSTATQSQARVLQLEQEKVRLTSNLSERTSQISTLQLEKGELKRTTIELQQKLDNALSERQGKGDEMSKLRAQLAEFEDQLTDVKRLHKEEKLSRKAAESKIDGVKEELSDMKTSNELLTKNLSERKKKALTEKRRFEEEVEDLKSQHEEELSHLREKLRKVKMSTTSNTSEKLSQIEEELNSEWQAKYDKMLATTQEKHARAMLDVQEERQQLENRLVEMEEKHEKLQGQATTMKGKYEDRITELTDENEELTEKMATLRKRYEERITQIIQERDEAIEKASISVQRPPLEEAAVDREAMVAQVKKIMNTVFHGLRAKFDVNTKYLGKDILQALLKIIKETTLKLSSGEESKGDKESSEEEEESEEESEESEQEDEEKVELVAETPLRAASVRVESRTQQEASQSPVKSAGDSFAQDSVSEPIKSIQSESDDDFSSDEEEPQPVVNEVVSDHKVAEPVSPTVDVVQEEAAPVPDDVSSSKEVAASGDVVMSEDMTPVTDIDTFQDVSDSKDVMAVNGEVTETSDEELYTSGSEARLEGTKSPDDAFVDASSASPVVDEKSPVGSLVEKVDVDEKDVLEVDLPTIDVIASSSEGDANPSETETSLGTGEPQQLTEEPKKDTLDPSKDVSELESSMEFEDSSRVPPPVDDHKPLFGADSDDEADPFGIGFAVKKETPVVDIKRDRSSSKTKTVKEKIEEDKNDTEDEDVKPQPPPPPLFGDDDDDDDLDWFKSK
ncbi:FK506-binding protein 15-like isoform X2 [Lineus longissimus]|uniref:FK506-binding protein 15-like isoform X2 n=1 Tax=Lineus longissimus TaxID=88925 RepID=UPI00315D357C